MLINAVNVKKDLLFKMVSALKIVALESFIIMRIKNVNIVLKIVNNAVIQKYVRIAKEDII